MVCELLSGSADKMAQFCQQAHMQLLIKHFIIMQKIQPLNLSSFYCKLEPVLVVLVFLFTSKKRNFNIA